MYKKQLKRVKYARRVVQRQQGLLADLELEGVVGLSLHTLTRSVTIGVGKDVSSHAAAACREALRERLQQLKAEKELLCLDWRESRESRARDKVLVQAAKRAEAQKDGPIPNPGELDANAGLS
ncbi:hypothetical protein [Hymenobacter arizonensis]|uniref:Uncharacterized protein n=1 Tax=Hymenobacter arizonensis TaxID=1227077 RepID=A0A1I5YZD9_HYMAR|nr:hypothetical protein [Hymenobacter arizonensis]SFQ49207.1 hypothetical protein SAMN04515668_2538 [Hymenobacter arizonensis]